MRVKASDYVICVRMTGARVIALGFERRATHARRLGRRRVDAIDDDDEVDGGTDMVWGGREVACGKAGQLSS